MAGQRQSLRTENRSANWWPNAAIARTSRDQNRPFISRRAPLLRHCTCDQVGLAGAQILNPAILFLHAQRPKTHVLLGKRAATERLFTFGPRTQRLRATRTGAYKKRKILAIGM